MADASCDYECPICLENLVPPIFQCYNGHLLCKDCIEGIRKCPICREEMPGRKIRNLEIERITSVERFICMYRSDGCTVDKKHDPVDCPLATGSFCASLGFNNCKEEVRKQDYAIHLMTAHGISGEFGGIGQPVDIQQMGGSLEDINSGTVALNPIFIAIDENILFLLTKVRPGNVSWGMFLLGSEAGAGQFRSKITISRSTGFQDHFITWCGRVQCLGDWRNADTLFNLYTQQLKSFCSENSLQSLDWNIRIEILKEGTDRTSIPNIPKFSGFSQIKSPATPLNLRPTAPPASEVHGSPAGSTSEAAPPVPPRNAPSLQPRREAKAPNNRDLKCPTCGYNPGSSKFIYKCLECESFNSCICTVHKDHSHHVILNSLAQNKVDFLRVVQILRRDGLEGNVSPDLSGVHRRIRCDGCKSSPVFGLRYKCVVCNDCDFCYNCFKKGIHSQHFFLITASPNTEEKLKYAFRKIRALKIMK